MFTWVGKDLKKYVDVRVGAIVQLVGSEIQNTTTSSIIRFLVFTAGLSTIGNETQDLAN